MKKKLMTVLALVLVIAMSVAGTYAYLTSQAKVENTFTVGKVAITLDESKSDDAGHLDTTVPRVKGNTYKLMPGHEYGKDPIVHVVADSESCYVFVKVEDGLANIETATQDYPSIAMQIANKGWTLLSGNVYYKLVSAADAKAGVDLPVFGGFKLTDNADTTKYGDAKITVTAYAIQADGMDDANAAWTAGGFGA